MVGVVAISGLIDSLASLCNRQHVLLVQSVLKVANVGIDEEYIRKAACVVVKQ